jgi:hypothetical protein
VITTKDLIRDALAPRISAIQVPNGGRVEKWTVQGDGLPICHVKVKLQVPGVAKALFVETRANVGGLDLATAANIVIGALEEAARAIHGHKLYSEGGIE